MDSNSRATFTAQYEEQSGGSFEAGMEDVDAAALHNSLPHAIRAECRDRGWDEKKDFAKGMHSFFAANPDLQRVWLSTVPPMRTTRG